MRGPIKSSPRTRVKNLTIIYYTDSGKQRSLIIPYWHIKLGLTGAVCLLAWLVGSNMLLARYLLDIRIPTVATAAESVLLPEKTEAALAQPEVAINSAPAELKSTATQIAAAATPITSSEKLAAVTDQTPPPPSLGTVTPEVAATYAVAVRNTRLSTYENSLIMKFQIHNTGKSSPVAGRFLGIANFVDDDGRHISVTSPQEMTENNNRPEGYSFSVRSFVSKQLVFTVPDKLKGKFRGAKLVLYSKSDQKHLEIDIPDENLVTN